MREVRSSSIVPGRPGDVVYLVLDDFGPIGRAYREADPDEDDEAYVIHNLMTAQYSRPQRIVAFNVAEGWAGDVTAEVARKVVDHAIARGVMLPDTTRELVERAIDTDVPAEIRG
jgi:hypothetical protein